MPRPQSDVEGGLIDKGFHRDTSGHHIYFVYHTIGGKKSPVFTKTSHGGREIGDDLLSIMARQCRVTRKNFFKLIDCALNRGEYEQLLRQRGSL